MNIKFLREGFANNSSSSHSIIFAGRKKTDKIEEVFARDYGFGWDEFVIKTQYTKFVYMMNSIICFIHMNYSASGLAYQRGWCENKKIQNLVKDFDKRFIDVYFWDSEFGRVLDAIGSNAKFLTKYFEHSEETSAQYRYLEGGQIGYVDHQSLISIPKTREGSKMNQRFAACLVKEIVEQNYVILGGNDNSDTSHKGDYSHYVSDGEKDLLKCLLFLKDNNDLIMAKYDEVAGHFVVSSEGGPIMFAAFSDNLIDSKLEG